jgi:hypothetical protein
MPPRHTYWTIILEGMPTAFRAHTEAELIPTLKQLQSKHPDVVMRWFSRGRLWNSPEEERAALAAIRHRKERRDRGWRPGGQHRDPRARFDLPRDEKRRRFAERLRRPSGASGPDRPSGSNAPGRPTPPRVPTRPPDRNRQGGSKRPNNDGQWRGPGGRGPGGRGPGGRGPGGRPPGGRGPGGRGPGGRGPGGRGPRGRGPGGRGPGGGGRGR